MNKTTTPQKASGNADVHADPQLLHLTKVLEKEFADASPENLKGALGVARKEGARDDSELLAVARKALLTAAPIIQS